MYPASCSSHLRWNGGSTATAFTVWMPVTDSTRNAWFSAPRSNFSLSRVRMMGVMKREIPAYTGKVPTTTSVRIGL